MVSLALIMGTIGTALASPLYPIYQALWRLMPSQITYIFVAYMFGCLATLLFLGRLSNSIGFLRSLQIGMGFIILGLGLSSIAANTVWLAVGRFIIGIASGLISTSAMLGLVYTIPEAYKNNAPQLSSVITVIGFGLGPFIGGVIAQFSAHPVLTPYLPVILGAIICLGGLYAIKTPSFESQPFSMAPHLELPQPQYKSLFYIAGVYRICCICFIQPVCLTCTFLCERSHSLAWSFGQWFNHCQYFAGFSPGAVLCQIASLGQMSELRFNHLNDELSTTRFMYDPALESAVLYQ